jgi:hypothetical protein
VAIEMAIGLSLSVTSAIESAVLVRADADLAALVVGVGPAVHHALGVVEYPVPARRSTFVSAKQPAKVGSAGVADVDHVQPAAAGLTAAVRAHA